MSELKEGKFLGKATDYKFEYDSSLINPIPRQENRTQINLTNNNLPFIGKDVWNAFEWTCLTDDGAPVVGILKLVYPCNSECIVESKSLKLYLNTFSMSRFGKTPAECAVNCQDIISNDLTKALKGEVQAKIFLPENWYTHFRENIIFIDHMLKTHVSVDSIINDRGCEVYKETPELLKTMTFVNGPKDEHRYVFHSLRSACKVTHQPDHGTVFIKMQPQKDFITPSSLYQYLVSFRNEFHFHEEICETIFKRILDISKPAQLAVACFYTRRGGIDINPIRATSEKYLEEYEPYMRVDILSPKFSRQ